MILSAIAETMPRDVAFFVGQKAGAPNVNVFFGP